MVEPIIPPATTQLLLCQTASWNASSGLLWRLERTTAGDWRTCDTPIAVILGRHGLAWGRGRHPTQPGRAKREGDGRAPAGVFAINALFGYPADDTPWAQALRLPYFAARPGLKCVDDPASRHYNCLVDQSTVSPDWRTSEDMLRTDARYEVGAVIAHNAAPTHPGAGSCIFLHVWETPDTPTSGCTAMARDAMLAIAQWLDGARQPLLVQLPEPTFHSLHLAWGLPCGDSLRAHR